MRWLSSWSNYPSPQTLGQPWSHDYLQANPLGCLSADIILELWFIDTEWFSLTHDIRCEVISDLCDWSSCSNTLLWPPQFLLYCEGTRFTEKKHQISMQVAESKGLPHLKYHLLPRTKGFTTTLHCLKGTGRQTLTANHAQHESLLVHEVFSLFYSKSCVWCHS